MFQVCNRAICQKPLATQSGTSLFSGQMAPISSYCSFFNSRLGFPNFVTENSIPSWHILSLHSSPFCQDAHACAVEPMTRILSSENALSQSLSFPAPLDKGNEGSGNEIAEVKELLLMIYPLASEKQITEENC